MYKASPQVPLISPYKGLSPLLIFTTFSTVYTLNSLSFLLKWTSPLITISYALVSSGCNELSTLAQEAVTQVFIKRTAIRKVPRTGKSHSSTAPLWNRREGNKLEFCYATALGDWLCHAGLEFHHFRARPPVLWCSWGQMPKQQGHQIKQWF